MEFLEKLKALSYRARLTIGLHSIYTLAETVGGVFFNLYLWQIGLARWWFGGLSLKRVRLALIKAGYKEE